MTRGDLQVTNKILSLKLLPSQADHSQLFQLKENSIGQNHNQEEIKHKLAMQLRNIGDTINHRMVREVSKTSFSVEKVYQVGKKKQNSDCELEKHTD